VSDAPGYAAASFHIHPVFVLHAILLPVDMARLAGYPGVSNWLNPIRPNRS
jgi:hypothetical protein